jgi:hypothetical protein
MQGPPAGDPAFQCPAYLIGHGFLAELVLECLEDRDSNDTLDPKKFLNARPERLEWIGPGPPVAPLLLLGGKLRIALDPARAALADTGLGGRDGLCVVTTMGHEQKNLLIRNVEARHRNPIVNVR